MAEKRNLVGQRSAFFGLVALVVAVVAAPLVCRAQRGEMSDEEFERLLAQARERYQENLARERSALEEAELARSTEDLQQWTDSAVSRQNHHAIQAAISKQNRKALEEEQQPGQDISNRLLRNLGSQSQPPAGVSAESLTMPGKIIFDRAGDTDRELTQSGTGTPFFSRGGEGNSGLVMPTQDNPPSTGNAGESAPLKSLRNMNGALKEMAGRRGKYGSLKGFPVPPPGTDPQKALDDLKQALAKLKLLTDRLQKQIKATDHQLAVTGQRLQDATARFKTTQAQLSQVQRQISALRTQRAMVEAESQRNYWVKVPHTIYSPTAGIRQTVYQTKWVGPGTPESWAAGIRGQLTAIDGQLAALQPRAQALNTQLQNDQAAAKQAQAQSNKLKQRRTQLAKSLGLRKGQQQQEQQKKIETTRLQLLQQEFLAEKKRAKKALGQLLAETAKGPFGLLAPVAEPLAREAAWTLDYYEDLFSRLLSKLKRRLESGWPYTIHRPTDVNAIRG